MRKIKTGAAVLAMMMAAGALPVFSQDMGLIIPMPGKKEIEKAEKRSMRIRRFNSKCEEVKTI